MTGISCVFHYGLLLVLLPAMLPLPAAVVVTVHDTRVIHTLPPRFHGTNFVALWNPTGDSPGTVAKSHRYERGIPSYMNDESHFI